MLNKELSHYAESNKSDNQIAEYICNTYLGELKKRFGKNNRKKKKKISTEKTKPKT